MTTSNKPPSGELLLVNYLHESSSGHYEKSRTVNLYAGKFDTIEMVEFEDECNQFKGPRRESKTTWTIERDALIEFIKSSGRQGPST